MRLLLDSHVIVWWSAYPSRLQAKTRDLITRPENEVFISAASTWELGLKMALGKLRLPADYTTQLLQQGLDELPVRVVHTVRAAQLPLLHNDPFDRLLIAQALVESLVLVTTDRQIVRYDVPVLDA